MSLLSSTILPAFEKALTAMEPEAAGFMVGQLKQMGQELLQWIESKGNTAAAKNPKDSAK